MLRRNQGCGVYERADSAVSIYWFGVQNKDVNSLILFTNSILSFFWYKIQIFNNTIHRIFPGISTDITFLTLFHWINKYFVYFFIGPIASDVQAANIRFMFPAKLSQLFM